MGIFRYIWVFLGIFWYSWVLLSIFGYFWVKYCMELYQYCFDIILILYQYILQGLGGEEGQKEGRKEKENGSAVVCYCKTKHATVVLLGLFNVSRSTTSEK